MGYYGRCDGLLWSVYNGLLWSVYDWTMVVLPWLLWIMMGVWYYRVTIWVIRACANFLRGGDTFQG